MSAASIPFLNREGGAREGGWVIGYKIRMFSTFVNSIWNIIDIISIRRKGAKREESRRK